MSHLNTGFSYSSPVGRNIRGQEWGIRSTGALGEAVVQQGLVDLGWGHWPICSLEMGMLILWACLLLGGFR